jgi:NTE family protein
MATFDLVFEGGGAKGSVFAGALEVFDAAGHKAGRLVGTSAGAITAALLAAGYTPAEMLEAVTEVKDGKPRFASFMDMPVEKDFPDFPDPIRAQAQLMKAFDKVNIPLLPSFLEEGLDRAILNSLLKGSPHFRQLFSFVECGGLFAGKEFVRWLNEKFGKKRIAEGTTLAQMHALKGCDLSLAVTDTTNRELMVLNHRTAPDVPVAMAVRMSMSIPFVWQEVIWEEQWGKYCGRSKTGSKIVDGGVLSNFPIDLIATAEQHVKEIMGEEADPTRSPNLGLLIDENLAVSPDIQGEPPRENPLATVRRIQRLMNTMTGARDNRLIAEHEAEICRLPAKGYGTTEFDMPADKMAKLVEAGRVAMKAHLAGRVLAAGV